MRYIKQQICNHYSRDYNDFNALKDLKILDIGCGGGLVCEPLARLGASVTGFDADSGAIDVAKAHAKESGLKIDYRNDVAEDMLSPSPSREREDRVKRDQGEGVFDIVLALEILEHVADLPGFIENCARLLKPGGLVIFSTLNRTPEAFALGIVAAEYILRWVPRGTHNWKKFIRPSELAACARDSGLQESGLTGMAFDLGKGEFILSDTKIAVNYFMTCVKPL